MDEIAYRERHGRAWLLILVCIGFVSVGFGFALAPSVDMARRILMGASGLFFLFLLPFWIRRLFMRGPTLILNQSGVRLPFSFSGELPWTEITNITTLAFRGGVTVSLHLAPQAAQFIRVALPMRWFNAKPRKLGILVSQIDANKDEVEAAIMTRWQAARATIASVEVPKLPPVTAIADQTPWATYVLIGLFVCVYVCELIFAYGDKKSWAPSVLTLAYLGGNISSQIVEEHEYWRMFTAPLLHADPLHIFINSLVFWVIGRSLERIVGWKWLFGIFALSALGGETASFLFLSPDIVAVGASGGLMGVIAASLVLASRLPIQSGIDLRIRALRWFVPALLPIFASQGSNVNYFAHGGGAVVGVILGSLMLKSWPKEAAVPPLANVSAVVTLIFFSVALYAIWPIAALYGQ